MSHLSPLSTGALEFRDQVRLLTAVSQLREEKVEFEHLVNLVPSVPISPHTGPQLRKDGFHVETGLAV